MWWTNPSGFLRMCLFLLTKTKHGSSWQRWIDPKALVPIWEQDDESGRIVDTCFNERVWLMWGRISSGSWMQKVYMLLMVWVSVFSFLAEGFKFFWWKFSLLCCPNFITSSTWLRFCLCLSHVKIQRMSFCSYGNQWKHPVACKDTDVSLVCISTSYTK